jgi:hypothetical protein
MLAKRLAPHQGNSYTVDNNGNGGEAEWMKEGPRPLVPHSVAYSLPTMPEHPELHRQSRELTD